MKIKAIDRPRRITAAHIPGGTVLVRREDGSVMDEGDILKSGEEAFVTWSVTHDEVTGNPIYATVEWEEL